MAARNRVQCGYDMEETPAPVLFDAALLRRRRRRALAEGGWPGFLGKAAADDIMWRLDAVTRQFADVVVLGAAGSDLPARVGARAGTRRVVACDEVAWPGIDTIFDHERPALADQSADCIVWPLGLARINDIPNCLARLARALRPDGLLLAVMLAGSSLAGLRRAWMQAEAELRGGAGPRVAPFADIRDLGGLLQRAGLALPVADFDRLIVRYDSGLGLMRDLKGMGLANPLVERPKNLTSPALMASAVAHFDGENADADGRVRAMFEFATLTAWSPHASQQKPLKPGSAKMRLAEALGTKEVKLKR